MEKLEDRTPLPTDVLRPVHRFVFGKTRPSLIIRLSVIINLAILFYFFTWNLISYISLLKREQIVAVETRIYLDKISDALNFQYYPFMHKLLSFLAYGLNFWILLFILIVCMYRKIKFGSLGIILFWFFYLAVINFYFNFQFLKQFITITDLVMIGISIVMATLTLIFGRFDVFRLNKFILEEEI